MIKVNKVISGLIESLKKEAGYELEVALNSHNEGFVGKYKPLNNLFLSELALCLIEGYKVEETKEDILLAHYNNVIDYDKEAKNDYSRGYLNGYQQAVKTVLSIYNIKIEGINA